jgi:hypothetical protein
MAEMMRRGLALSRDEATDSTFMLPALSHAAADGLWLSMPVLGAITLARSSRRSRSAAGAFAPRR